MSQQALDLRRSMQVVRRHKLLVGIVVVLGIAGGAAYAVHKPPTLTSTALVALQEPVSAQQANSSTTTTGGTDSFTTTQEIVVGSYPVLVDALPDVRPAMSFDQLRHNVQVGSLSSGIISVNGKGQERCRRRSNRQRCG